MGLSAERLFRCSLCVRAGFNCWLVSGRVERDVLPLARRSK
jgi:hypothetical protein